MAYVDVQELTKVYQQGEERTYALDKATLAVEKGEFTALAGPSGSGKSTLLNLIGALDLPTGGEIAVDGVRYSELNKAQRTERRLWDIGFVFQAYNLIPVLSAFENTEFILLLQGVPQAERKQRVMEILEAVGLADRARRRPAELSGGQQQRVAVARAMVTRPKIILADEPTANLDSKTAAGLIDLMLKLNQERGTTFLFSTHDPSVIANARRVVKLRDGKIVDDLRKQPQTKVG